MIAYRPLLVGEPDPRTAKPAAADQGRPNEPPSQSIEERRQALKRLRDQNVITEEEFTSKKRALLERLCAGRTRCLLPTARCVTSNGTRHHRG
ncbi:SHOCT domain-containing protein [Nitrospira sp. Kam-Ns4a]